MSRYKQTFNPCDECSYSFGHNAQDTGMCDICEFKRYKDLEEQGQFIDIEDIPFLWKEYVEADPDTLTEGAKQLADKLRKSIDLIIYLKKLQSWKERRNDD